jgi:hypothetical protein
VRNSLLLFVFLLGAAIASAEPAQNEIEIVPDSKTYGEFPIAYKEIITKWLGTRLADPASAVIEWGDPPKPGEVSPKKGQRFVGYVVDFKVNARNRFGTYTGKQKYRVLIRNGEVLWGGRPPLGK